MRRSAGARPGAACRGCQNGVALSSGGGLSLAGAGAGAEAVERLLARFDERAAELATRLGDGAPRPAARAFERAREEREAAARALADRRLERALRHARSAHDLLEQAARGLR